MHKVDDTLKTKFRKCTPFEFAKHKKWNDIVAVFENDIDGNGKKEEYKEYEYS